MIDADGMQMRQILQNPIGNALKFRQEDIAPLVKGIVCHSFGMPITRPKVFHPQFVHRWIIRLIYFLEITSRLIVDNAGKTFDFQTRTTH